ASCFGTRGATGRGRSRAEWSHGSSTRWGARTGPSSGGFTNGHCCTHRGPKSCTRSSGATPCCRTWTASGGSVSDAALGERAGGAPPRRDRRRDGGRPPELRRARRGEQPARPDAAGGGMRPRRPGVPAATQVARGHRQPARRSQGGRDLRARRRVEPRAPRREDRWVGGAAGDPRRRPRGHAARRPAARCGATCFRTGGLDGARGARRPAVRARLFARGGGERAPGRDRLSERPVGSAHILFTSGSTGMPKGVVITHANVTCFIEWAVRHFGLGPLDRTSGHAPLHFDLSTFDVFGSFAAGAALHLVPHQLNLLPHKLAEFIRTAELTQWFSVP